MIKTTYNKHLRTYTIRRIFNGVTIAKYRTEKVYFKEREKMNYFGAESWNNYIKDNNLQNLKK